MPLSKIVEISLIIIDLVFNRQLNTGLGIMPLGHMVGILNLLIIIGIIPNLRFNVIISL
jgi:hypothetical protein